MPVVNKIVTRGLGPARDGVGNRAGPLTRGYGGKFIRPIVEIIRRQIPHGISGLRRRQDEYEEITVCAKLIGINDHDASHKNIEGCVTVKVPTKPTYARAIAEVISKRATTLWEQVKIHVTRVKKG